MCFKIKGYATITHTKFSVIYCKSITKELLQMNRIDKRIIVFVLLIATLFFASCTTTDVSVQEENAAKVDVTHTEIPFAKNLVRHGSDTVALAKQASQSEDNIADNPESVDEAGGEVEIEVEDDADADDVVVDAGKKVKGEWHHIASDKSIKSGFTEAYKKIFDKAGMTLDDEANIVFLEGHSGAHTNAYKQYVLDTLLAATEGLSGSAYKEALLYALEDLRQQLLENPRLPYKGGL